MTRWKFDREKFKELIAFVAWRCADDPNFGDTFLNKVLFFSDALALQHFGEPITGARYQKLKYGPAPRALLPVRDEMVKEGVVTVETVGDRTVTRATRDAEPVFSEEQRGLVEAVIEAFRGMWATHISDASHELSPGWQLVEMGEDIPLESQLISTRPVSETTLRRGRELAKLRGW
jgi:uncharacterized phage-associated protein